MKASVILGITLTIPFCFGSARAGDCVSKASKGIESGRPQEALGSLKKGARNGDERCKFILGMWSLAGTGMKPDAKSASRWLREAAVEGLPMAQSRLGLLYASGWGVEEDAKQAADWYRAAAHYGDPLGQAALGAATFLGDGVPEDRVEGFMWTSLAAAQGDEKASAHLPAMEAAMTTDEIEQAKREVEEFRPKKRSERRPVSRRDALRAVGINRGEPTEYDRFLGY
jgi:TPR repeat protein